MIGIRSLQQLRLQWLGLVVACASLCACIQVEGVHEVNAVGATDFGSYSIAMNSTVLESMGQQGEDFIDKLRTVSNPRISRRGDNTYISDRSGYARMEKFYDKISCHPVGSGWNDCTYVMRQKDWSFPGWSFDWKVVLPKEWTVIDANDDRTFVSGGQRELLWYFDGNRVNSFDITFTVRIPNA